MKKPKVITPTKKDVHLVRPPRLEGKVKNAMMNPVRKPKKVIKSKPQKQWYQDIGKRVKRTNNLSGR